MLTVLTTETYDVTVFTDPHTPISIYTDGSFNAATRTMGWGWLVENPLPHRAAWALDSMYTGKSNASKSGMMESKAIVNAIAEFSHHGRPIHIHADNQYLMMMVERYRAGVVGTEVFLERPNGICQEDGRRLLQLMATVDFEIFWVKAHSSSFENLVIDHAIRIAGEESLEAAEAFLFNATEAREAVVWGSFVACEKEGRPIYTTGYHRVADC